MDSSTRTKLQHMFVSTYFVLFVFFVNLKTSDMMSKDLMDQFRECMQQSHDDMVINFSIMVLGMNFWSLNTPNNDFVIPADIHP